MTTKNREKIAFLQVYGDTCRNYRSNLQKFENFDKINSWAVCEINIEFYWSEKCLSANFLKIYKV